MEANYLTSDASQIELVTLALYLLGGDRHVIDTEDVAVKVHELAPGRFAWRKYPEQINLELVRVYLSAAKDPERGGLVDGTGRAGWSLTGPGLEWATQNAHQYVRADLTRSRTERRSGSVDERRWQRERTRVLTTGAWTLWAEGRKDEISPRQAEDVFRIDTYAVGRTRSLKIARIRDMFAEDPDVEPFVQWVALRLKTEDDSEGT